MKQKEIENSSEMCRTCLEQWLGFRKYFVLAKSGQDIPPDAEIEFLDHRTNMNRMIRALAQKVDEKEHPFGGDKMRELMKATTTIENLQGLPENDQAGLFKLWHEAKVMLSRAVGEFAFRSEGYSPPVKKTAKKKGNFFSKLFKKKAKAK